MGPAVAVRAYLESYDAATLTLDPNNVYPGFLRATPANQEREGDYLTQLTRIRPLVGYTKGPKDAWTHYGFVTYHVLHLNPKGNAFEAIVCGGEYSHFVNSLAQPGKFVSVAVNEATGKPYTSGSGLSVHRIEFTQSDSRVGANPPAPVAAPQRGPAPAPDQDEFGNWFITAAGSHYWGPINDPQSRNFPTPDLERQCAERMPQNEAERTAMMSGFKDEPPPPGQAEPGWPLKAN